MTALEALYNKFWENEKHICEDFYDAFQNDCPTTFFKGLDSLCKIHKIDDVGVCCKCWLQEVDIYNMPDEEVSYKAKYHQLLQDVHDYQGSICCYCKHYNRNNCEHFGDLPHEDGIPLSCGKFMWRQEERT